MEPAPAMAERRVRSKADIFPDEVAETCQAGTAARQRCRREYPRLLNWPHEKTDRENSMRAIGLVLLSIAIMALLLTDADAKRRRSSTQGSQGAEASRSWCATYGRKGISDNCSYASEQQCLAQVWGLGGFCRPNPFPGTAYGTGGSWSSGAPR